MSLNYSTEEEEKLKKLYIDYGTANIQKIADELGKPVPSVRQKLVKMDIYKPLPKKTSTRKEPTKKELMNEIEDITGFDATGFKGATKKVLNDLIVYLKSSE